MRSIFSALQLCGLAALIWACSCLVHADPVRVGYQTTIDPGKLAQADQRLTRALGGKVDWQLFSSGPAVVAALASGSIQLGNIGSVPLATALSRHLPLVVFFIISRTEGAEALVVRPAIQRPEQLTGQLIATPFGSTAHYSLLKALQHWHLSTKQVRLVNLSPGDIAAAWQRGDIAGGYVWSPALSVLQHNGHVLTDSSQIGRWGGATFDVWVAQRSFAEQHPEALRRFTAAILQDYRAYRRDPNGWAHAHAQVFYQLTGVPPAQVPAMLAGSYYPLADEQRAATAIAGGAARDLTATATFLQQQNVIVHTLSDYRRFFSAAYLPPSSPNHESDH